MIRAKTLPIDKREGLVEAFATFKQTVVWKYENDTLPNQPSNVHIRKWMPQRDILCHPNVRVFMTHGGLLGISEAAYCGVAVVSKTFRPHYLYSLMTYFPYFIGCYTNIW